MSRERDAVVRSGEAPRIAIVDEDAGRVHGLAEMLEQAGYATHAFTSASRAAQGAPALGLEVMLVEHGIREMPLRALHEALARRMGAHAPQLVVLTRRLHEMPIPERSRYVAVLPRPVELDRLLAAIETAVARHARATVLEAHPVGPAHPVGQVLPRRGARVLS